MNSINIEKYKFKRRSLPNSKNFKRYLEAYIYYFLFLVIYNFVEICLFSDGLMPTIPAPFVFAIPILFVHIYKTIENEFKNVHKDTFREIVTHIRLKQTQSLIEKIEDHPEILKETFNNKSLLYWAKHYNNIHANTILTKQLHKLK